MKAKVIETGEIVNVTPYPTWYKENGQGPDRREWDEDELEFIYSDKKEENHESKERRRCMTYTIEEIYRVVCTDQYQSTTPETCWTTNKQSCEEYIANSYYKHCLSIETSRMSDIAVKL